MLIHATVAAALLMLAGPVPSEEPVASDGKKVVLFVCEHGAAKSVMAAAHFNQRARERRLPLGHAAEELGTDDHIAVGVRGQLLENGLGLVVDLLGEEALAARSRRQAEPVGEGLPEIAELAAHAQIFSGGARRPESQDGHELARVIG